MNVDTAQQTNEPPSPSSGEVQRGHPTGQPTSSSSQESQKDKLTHSNSPFSPSDSSKMREGQGFSKQTPSPLDEMDVVKDDSNVLQSALQKPNAPPVETGDVLSQERFRQFETGLLTSVQKALDVVTDRLHAAHVDGALMENAILPYQQKLAAALRVLEDLRKTSDTQPSSGSEKLEKLVSELSSIKSKANELREEKRDLEQRLVKRDRLIADDAEELVRLRGETNEIPELRAKLSDAVNRHVSSETKLAEVERTLTVRAAAAEEGVRSLNSKIVELTTQMTEARCEAEALRASYEMKANDAKERASQAMSEAARLKADHSKMQRYIDKLESQLSDTKCSAKELNKTFEDEVANMNKMLELNEQRANEAESRARDLMEELKQERELSMKREKRRLEKRTLAPHAETLLSDMEVALETRWAALEAQKNEMERARQSEMSVLAAQEKLRKEKIDAQFLAEQQRKECLRLTRQVEQQADEIERLKRSLDSSKEISQYSFDPATTSRPDAGMGAPSPVLWRNSTESRPSGDAMDIGPESTIPTHYFPSPSNRMPEDYHSSIRQLSAIRREHQHLLESLRDNRISFG